MLTRQDGCSTTGWCAWKPEAKPLNPWEKLKLDPVESTSPAWRACSMQRIHPVKSAVLVPASALLLFMGQGVRPRFSAPITLAVMPEECQSIPITEPNDWNQEACARHAIAQPFRHATTVKRQVRTAGTAYHQRIPVGVTPEVASGYGMIAPAASNSGSSSAALIGT